jgi:hypothetical protein
MPARRKVADTRSDEARMLEFVAGLLALPRDADDTARVALAARLDIPSDTAARILDKTPAAIQKAYERARKKGK